MVDIEAYYERYGAMVYRRCLSVVRNHEAALDLTQDVFVALMRNADRLSGTAPSSLLYTIATNLSLNHLRAGRGRSTVDLDLVSAGASDPSHEAVLTRHFLERLFAEESDTTRLIAWLHYVDGLTLGETAAQVGMSVSGIRKRLRRLRSLGESRKEA